MAPLIAQSPLRAIARAYSARAVNDAPFVQPPLADQLAGEDEAAVEARLYQLSYEVPADGWRPIVSSGEPAAAPLRFVDGTLSVSTVAALKLDGRLQPVVLACFGAMALRRDGRGLLRETESLRLESALCFFRNGMRPQDCDGLREAARDLGLRVIAPQSDGLSMEYEVSRRQCQDLARQQMDEAERAVMVHSPAVPTLVDGLLERRLIVAATRRWPVLGMVKRQLKRYLPDSHINRLYELSPGERTPAFVLETDHGAIVTWYLRLAPLESLSLGYGVVRLSLPQEYLEELFPSPVDRSNEISALSAFVYGLRHRESSYPRAAISIEPIVRVEDELKALLPDVDQQVARCRLAMGLEV